MKRIQYMTEVHSGSRDSALAKVKDIQRVTEIHSGTWRLKVKDLARCAFAPAANAPTSLWRSGTHVMSLLARTVSMMLIRESPATPRMRITPAKTNVLANNAATVFFFTCCSFVVGLGFWTWRMC